MSATAESLIIDLDMVAVGSDMERSVLDLARAMLKSQAARVVELEEQAEPEILDEDQHPCPKDGSEFEIIFRRPESQLVQYIEYKRRWQTVDGYGIEGDVEGWRPIPDQRVEGRS